MKQKTTKQQKTNDNLNSKHNLLFRMSYTYLEDNQDENGAVYEWKHTSMKHSIQTHRGTKVEMVHRPGWGVSCFMDGVIQSCEKDEYLYHESLVHPVMASAQSRKRVMIMGGGEGATAREVLRWPDVEMVDMYEWDKDVVQLFQTNYPQWAKGAWGDPRLRIHYQDIFDAIRHTPTEEQRYDIILIDLFDPTNDNILSWYDLFMKLDKWIHKTGSIVVYTGIRNILQSHQPYEKIISMLEYHDTWQDMKVKLIPLQMSYTPYKVFIPSFMGEATFVLLQPSTNVRNPTFDKKIVSSHVTNEIWKSYQTWNW
jgi:spermidine synthase